MVSALSGLMKYVKSFRLPPLGEVKTWPYEGVALYPHELSELEPSQDGVVSMELANDGCAA